MASAVGERTLLTPPGEAAVDQSGIAGHEIVGSDPETFTYPGSERFTEDIGPFDESAQQFDTGG